MNYNDVRLSLDKMRKGGYSIPSKKKSNDISMRDLLKITRTKTLNEDEDVDNGVKVNKANPMDQKAEEEKFKDAFQYLKVIVDFQPLKVYDDYIFWGGTINNAIQFVYKITPTEELNNVEINYLKDFKPEDPENKEIAEKIEDYYNDFFERWKDQIKET